MDRASERIVEITTYPLRIKLSLLFIVFYVLLCASVAIEFFGRYGYGIVEGWILHSLFFIFMVNQFAALLIWMVLIDKGRVKSIAIRREARPLGTAKRVKTITRNES